MTRTRFENLLGPDVGHVELARHCGDDLRSVNNARGSYNKKALKFELKDARLLKKLAYDIHTTPPRGGLTVMLDIDNIPIPIAMQWYKHIVGTDYAFKDCPWSQVSGRYTEAERHYYMPKEWRRQDAKNKQKSVSAKEWADTVIGEYNKELLVTGPSSYTAMRYKSRREWATDLYINSAERCWDTYQKLLQLGVCREQARFVLPGAALTSFRWTASVEAIVHFCVLRTSSHAQWEIQQLAIAVDELVRPLAPETYQNFWDNHPVTLRARIKELEKR